MAKRIGKSIIYENSPEIAFWAAGVGKKESEGPFGHEFDRIYEDTTLGEESWEKSESRLLLNTAEDALKKGKMVWDDIDCVFCGDLLSQSIASSFAFRNTGVSVCGLYGACSTMALSLINAANTLESGATDTVISATASHFCSSERQFRFPLEYGEIRTPSAQWTVTGAGAAILKRNEGKVKIRASRIGEIVDMGVSDANNMGAAMAPVSVRIGYIRERNPSVQIRRRYAIFRCF